MADVLDFTDPVFRLFYSDVYQMAGEHSHGLCGAMYRLTDISPDKSSIVRMIDRISLNRTQPFADFIKKTTPDSFVATHFLPMSIAARMKRHGLYSGPLVHLGTRWSKAEELACFLSSIRCEKLFLVGDIIDGWKLRNNPRWPRSHNLVIRKILKMAKKTEILYITGNHDEFADEFEGYGFGGIRICKKAVHITADQRRFLVIHGDEFDVVVKYRKWLALLGDTAYTFSLYLNTLLTLVRSRLGLPYWSLSQYLKHRVKDAVAFVGDFEDTLLEETRRGQHHGVICGHIHHPAIRNLKDAVYCNTGDWVESCSALVEHRDGSFGIVRWDGEKIIEDVSERPRLLPVAPATPPEAAPEKKRRVPVAV